MYEIQIQCNFFSPKRQFMNNNVFVLNCYFKFFKVHEDSTISGTNINRSTTKIFIYFLTSFGSIPRTIPSDKGSFTYYVITKGEGGFRNDDGRGEGVWKQTKSDYVI